MKTSHLGSGAVACLLCVFSLVCVASEPGDLDVGFSGDGMVTVAIGSADDRGLAVAVQSDDKVVVAGSRLDGDDDFALVRLTSAGALDTTFSVDGRATATFLGGDDRALAVAIQADGRIVAAGFATPSADADFAVARLNSSGVLDTGFNADGRVTTGIGPGDDVAQALAIQSDGRVLVAGYSWNGTDDDFALVRYGSDGSLDAGAGALDGDGRLTTDFAGADDRAMAIAVQSDGRILVAGTSGSDIVLARYDPDGGLDGSFGTGGSVTTDLGALEQGLALALQSDGRILVAGSSLDAFTGDELAVVLRYESDGTLDDTFDDDGIQSIAFSAGRSRANAVRLQADGRILVGGVAEGAVDDDFALARLTDEGSLDTEFGIDGWVLTDFGAGDDVARALALQSTGRILLAGYANNGTDDDIAVARYRDVPGPAAIESPDGGGGGCVLAGAGSDNGLFEILLTVLLLRLLASASLRRRAFLSGIRLRAFDHFLRVRPR